jgi:hypothetical protein
MPLTGAEIRKISAAPRPTQGTFFDAPNITFVTFFREPIKTKIPFRKKSPEGGPVTKMLRKEQSPALAKLLATGGAFGCFQRVDANLDDCYLGFGMGGKIADAHAPFGRGIHVRIAVFIAFRLDDPFAPFAFIDYRQERTFAEFCHFACLHVANS